MEVFVAAPDYARIVTDQGDEYEFYGEKDGRPVRVEGCIETLRKIAKRHLGLFPRDTTPWPGLLAPSTTGVMELSGCLRFERTRRLRQDPRRDDDCPLGRKNTHRAA